jgi:hypothetical protein
MPKDHARDAAALPWTLVALTRRLFGEDVDAECRGAAGGAPPTNLVRLGVQSGRRKGPSARKPRASRGHGLDAGLVEKGKSMSLGKEVGMSESYWHPWMRWFWDSGRLVRGCRLPPGPMANLWNAVDEAAEEANFAYREWLSTPSGEGESTALALRLREAAFEQALGAYVAAVEADSDRCRGADD